MEQPVGEKHASARGSQRTQLSAGTIALTTIASFRPTQGAVGMRAVARKRRKLENRVAKGRRVEKVLRARPIPTVLGPNGALYLVDCHLSDWHFGRPTSRQPTLA